MSCAAPLFHSSVTSTTTCGEGMIIRVIVATWLIASMGSGGNIGNYTGNSGTVLWATM